MISSKEDTRYLPLLHNEKEHLSDIGTVKNFDKDTGRDILEESDNLNTVEVGTINVPAGRGPHRRRQRLTCSERFRSSMAERYPEAARNPEYWAVLEYLLLSPSHLNDGRISLSRKKLAAVVGQGAQERSGRFKSGDLLDSFRQDVMPGLRWNGYVAREECRTVRTLGLSDETLLEYDDELSTQSCRLERRVYFGSGQPFSYKSQAAEREAMRERAQAQEGLAPCAVTGAALSYMNGLAPHRFGKLLVKLPDAYEVAYRLPDVEQRRALLRNLRAFADQTQPFYKPVERSVRIFGDGLSLTTMKKEARRVLTSDWTEFDLRSAQLAICATLWEVDPVRRFLEADGNIWQSLLKHLGWDYGRPDTSEVKGPLKEALYSLTFGMCPRGIQRALTLGLRDRIRNPGQGFFSHPLIQTLYEARERELERVREDGGASDCFERWISSDADRRGPERSVMAQVAQASEQMLLVPALDMARQSDLFDITLWSHDGFSVAFRDASKRRRLEGRLMSAVNRNAESLGIPTVLEIT